MLVPACSPDGVDVTVVTGTAGLGGPKPSRKSVTAAQRALEQRHRAKLRRYDGRVRPLVFSSSGGMHKEVVDFVRMLAIQYESALTEPDSAAMLAFERRVLDELAIALQRSQAREAMAMASADLQSGYGLVEREARRVQEQSWPWHA